MKEHVITPPHDGRRAFNASICEWDDKLWMAYRVSYTDQPDRLRIAELHRDTFAVLSDQPLSVPVSDGWGAEDPRLFVHRDVLHVAWTAADYERRPWRATMFYGAVSWSYGPDSVQVRKAYQPRYGFNLIDQREKNWQFFSLGGCLFAQYGPSPQRVIQLDGDKVIGESQSEGFAWAHGRPSGGTPPVRNSVGKLVSFFHAFEPHRERERRYNFGVMEFDAVVPFRVRAVSPAPILTAHDRWPTTGDEWSPLCVFPAGAIPHGDGYLVSAGVNDHGIRLFEIEAADMPTVEPERVQAEATGYFRATAGFMLGGRVRTPGEILEIGLDAAHHLIERNWIHPHENQTT